MAGVRIDSFFPPHKLLRHFLPLFLCYYRNTFQHSYICRISWHCKNTVQKSWTFNCGGKEVSLIILRKSKRGVLFLSPSPSFLITILSPFPSIAVYELHAARQINSLEKCTFLFGNNAISLLDSQQSYFASTVFKSKMKNYIEDVCVHHIVLDGM